MVLVFRLYLSMITCFFVIVLSALPLSASDLDAYRRSGVTVAGSAFWKPYSFVDINGEPTGFFIDYWRKWSEKTGVPVRFRLTSWKESIDLVASGECDIHSGFYFTQERARVFGFSEPVFHSKGVVVVSTDTSCGTDMSANRWGGVAGTEEKKIADLRSSTEAVSFKNSADMFRALVDGTVQAVVDDWSSALMLGKDLGISESIKICEDVYTKDLHAGVLKKNAALLELVDMGIQRITDAEYRLLVDRWYVNHGGEQNPWTRAWPILFLVLAVWAGFALNKWLRKV